VSNKAISKTSSLPVISVGFGISILVATWVAGARFTSMAQADAAAMVEIADVQDRQKKYIGTTGLLTGDINDLQDRLADLEVELALLKLRLEIDGNIP
jgi:O-succinylbenzoate synthase|tara:strand:- start:519 stop:812 length:294 start_codon:yes stop_codon:yes gene_type:complete